MVGNWRVNQKKDKLMDKVHIYIACQALITTECTKNSALMIRLIQLYPLKLTTVLVSPAG